MRPERIVVMDNGRIIEDGTHAALIAAGGVDARFWDAWNGAQEFQDDAR